MRSVIRLNAVRPNVLAPRLTQCFIKLREISLYVVLLCLFMLNIVLLSDVCRVSLG
jgi:hypothetical protein